MKELIFPYIKSKTKTIALFLICTCILIFVLWLDNAMNFTVWYAFILCFLTCIGFGIVDFAKYYKLHKELMILKNKIAISISELPVPKNLLVEDYTELIKTLSSAKENVELASNKSYKEMIDYYTIWVHQIKTPIAAMRLLLQANESPENAELELELLRIEQYVDMALSYLRIDSNESDFILKQYDIDDIIKQVLRKNAKMFIRKKISLEYEGVNITTITDEKWLNFVIDQIISNSLKYTNQGSIKIYAQDNKTLVIEDTGIGIAKEDLPRVFDKSYTGYNGRRDKKATGLGLYLCKRILKKLGHSISIDSEPDVGTKVAIDLSTYNLTPND